MEFHLAGKITFHCKPWDYHFHVCDLECHIFSPKRNFARKLLQFWIFGSCGGRGRNQHRRAPHGPFRSAEDPKIAPPLHEATQRGPANHGTRLSEVVDLVYSITILHSGYTIKAPCGVFFPQIAGSYRGSYFSMDGFRIAEIGCRCRLVSQACLPS